MIRLFEDFSHYGRFDEIKPKIGEFIVFKIKKSDKIYVVEIMSDMEFSSYDILYSEAFDHINNYSFKLYYDYRKNDFLFGMNLPANIILRTMNSEDAFDYYNMIKNVEKYNL